MTYKEKIKYAGEAADALLNETPISTIKEKLKGENLYEKDVDEIMISARNILGDKLKPVINGILINKGDFKSDARLSKLDDETLIKLINQEKKVLFNEERRKVKALLKQGASHEEIAAKVRLEFYPAENIIHQVKTYESVKEENSSGKRGLKIFGGLAMMLIGGGVSFASMGGSGGGRLFYGLILVGLFTLIQGFMTVEDPY